MRKLYTVLFLIAFVLAGCTTAQPIVRIDHILVAPEDNLLVNCEVSPPPLKRDYLTNQTSLISSTPLSIQKDPLDPSPLEQALAVAEERERLLTQALLKNYQNLDACNKRLKGLREWKAKSIQALSSNNRQE